MKKVYKRIDVEELVVGQRYFVKCGCWHASLIFTHSEYKGKRKYYNFTFGTLDNYKTHFNLYSTKSNFKIYKEI